MVIIVQMCARVEDFAEIISWNLFLQMTTAMARSMKIWLFPPEVRMIRFHEHVMHASNDLPLLRYQLYDFGLNKILFIHRNHKLNK